MKRSGVHAAATRDDLLAIFEEIDGVLLKEKKRCRITAIGGVSIICLGIRERATQDIDIANVDDAVAFQQCCAKRNVKVDIVTIASTVDLAHAPRVKLYEGEALKVESISAEDLLKLKLERFRKQDPEDIYAIIGKAGVSSAAFRSLVNEMLPYFIGNPRELLLSALIVVERMYPEDQEDFKTLLAKFK